MARVGLPKPQTVEEANRAVQESYSRGYRRIKIIRDDTVAWSGEAYRAPLMPRPVYNALVSRARALGMRIYVHAAQRYVAQESLAVAVDAFIHGVMDEELDASDLQLMADSNVT